MNVGGTVMESSGPAIESLMRRLAACPPDFLAAPRIGNQGVVHVAAVVSDLLLQLGGPGLTPREAGRFDPGEPAEADRLRAVLVTCWLLDDDELVQACRRAPDRYVPAVRAFLSDDVATLAGLAAADQWVRDEERREELARLVLRTLGLTPRGESTAQAQDRLNTVNSVERNRVIAAARAAEERSQAIRDAMAKKAAEEAAAKYSRE